MSQTPQQTADNGPEGLSRREFIKAGVFAGAVPAVGLGAFYFGYGASVGSPVRVGVIGTGDEGSVLIGAINPAYIEVRSIADIRPYNLHRAFHGDYYSDAALKARPGLMAKYGWKTEDQARRKMKVYGRYQELIEKAGDDGIEAVIIALPLHLHAPAAIAAMRAGLHVMTEKLMAHSVHECKEMARVANQTGLYLATGHQRHYNVLYAEAVDQIRRGLLGELHYIRAQWHRGNLPGSDSWQQPLPPGAKPPLPKNATDVEKKLATALEDKLKSWRKKLDSAVGREIDVWRKRVAQVEAQIADKAVEAEKHGYASKVFKYPGGQQYNRPAIEELIRWRLWQRTGGGLMAELGSHQLDAASIFISAVHGGKKQYPLSVAAAANRPIFPPDREVDDHVYCLFEFPAPDYDPKDPHNSRKKIGVQYASINGNGYGGYGEMVFGTKGTLILEREKEIQLFQGPSASKVKVEGQGGPTMDTQASGEAQEAVSGPAREVSRGYTEELEHWAWCIRNQDEENQPRCHPKVALADAVIALTTNMAARKGARIEFEKEWFDPDDDATPEDVKPDLSRYKLKL